MGKVEAAETNIVAAEHRSLRRSDPRLTRKLYHDFWVRWLARWCRPWIDHITPDVLRRLAADSRRWTETADRHDAARVVEADLLGATGGYGAEDTLLREERAAAELVDRYDGLLTDGDKDAFRLLAPRVAEGWSEREAAALAAAREDVTVSAETLRRRFRSARRKLAKAVQQAA
jgi:hypothetical protein